MATLFEAALLRLKGALQVTTDKEVAELLGMSPNALNERKRRDAFPEDKVRALAARLHFDADYVITGVAQAAQELIEAAREGRPMKKVGPEDQALLAHWHQCEPADQVLLLALIKRLGRADLQVTNEAHHIRPLYDPVDKEAEERLRNSLQLSPALTGTPAMKRDGKYPKREETSAPALHDAPPKKER